MEALTQCWYTRIHQPSRERHRQEDGSVSSTCRYCHRPIASWDRANWNLANGLDVTRLAETLGGRTLTLIDTLSDLVVHRYPIRHLEDEGAVEAFKQALRVQYALDDPTNKLELRDSLPPAARRKLRVPAARSGDGAAV